MTAGPGPTLRSRLEIGDDAVFTVRNPPAGFRDLLGDLGGAVWQQNLLAPLDVVITFLSRRDALDLEWPRITEPLAPDGAVWVAHPRPASGVVTDITDDALRASRLKQGWLDTKVLGIDDTWIAVRFVKKPAQLRPKDNARRKR